MKKTLKILGLFFTISITISITMVSCETLFETKEELHKPTIVDWTKLHHIRPTKPIRIPDTMAIKAKPAILEYQLDTTISHPQDSIPQEQLKIEN